MAKKMMTFKFSLEMGDALNELTCPEALLKMVGVDSKTAYLEDIFAWFLYRGMKGHVNDTQLETARTPAAKCKLYVNYSRAQRGIEGYGITAAKYVYGPDEAAIFEKVKNLKRLTKVEKEPAEDGPTTIIDLDLK